MKGKVIISLSEYLAMKEDIETLKKEKYQLEADIRESYGIEYFDIQKRASELRDIKIRSKIMKEINNGTF